MATTKNLDREAHIVGTGSGAVVIDLPDVYGNIADLVGVRKVTGDIPDGASSTTVRMGIKTASFIKMYISYMEGTKRRYSQIIVSVDKVKTAPKAVIGKTYNSFKIKTAGFSSRRRLG
ncbi:MAG: hypothetical protein KME50_16160 [Nostoc desertorum CM1-VF14]|jgi:hypothetical protein|nr:hypothetical protein [Nostoc desertorum CM1-VF14]